MHIEYSRTVTARGGRPVVSPGFAGRVREGRNPCTVIAQRGSQENFLRSTADIVIFGGNRGGAKSFSLLMESLKDIRNRSFNALILRNEKDDLRDIINTSHQLYAPFGSYNRSVNDMTWNFNSGGRLWFSYYADSFEDFRTRFQGKQFCYIGIDEITQCSYRKFKYLITCNRNASHIRNRFYGTCNPDPDSWVRRFIDWWIGPDGFPIPERDAAVRYCFMDGDSPEGIFWGNTPEEVYMQCRDIIDPLWKKEYEALGFNRTTMFVKSACFIRGRLEENIRLLESDPNYLANLAQQDEDQRARDLEGNWNRRRSGEDRISISDMERFFSAPRPEGRDTRYVSADIAFQGGDFCVMWLWEGHHIADLYVTQGTSDEVESRFKATIAGWGVREENVVFDFWGVGQSIAGHVRRAVKFTGTSRPREPFDKSYRNVKSQCADMLVHQLQDGTVTIEPRLLSMRFSGKKGKYSDTPLSDILMRERKCIRHSGKSAIGGFELCGKDAMIKAVGYSPDFFESLIYRMYFDIGTHHRPSPRGMASYTGSPQAGPANGGITRVSRIRFV